jgi:hypothetical protein
VTSHVTDTTPGLPTLARRTPRWPHPAADGHIQVSASPAPVAIRKRHHPVLTRTHAIDLEA